MVKKSNSHSSQNDIILYVKSPKLLELIQEFSIVAGYKIDAQKSVAFLYTNNEMEERETEESIPFTIALNTIRYLGINPPKETRICTLKKTGHSGKKLRNHKELKSFHVHGLEEQILLKCLCKLEQSLHSMQSLSKYYQLFF